MVGACVALLSGTVLLLRPTGRGQHRHPGPRLVTTGVPGRGPYCQSLARQAPERLARLPPSPRPPVISFCPSIPSACLPTCGKLSFACRGREVGKLRMAAMHEDAEPEVLECGGCGRAPIPLAASDRSAVTVAAPPRDAPAANCGTTQNLLKCSRCHTAWFCGVKCQKVGSTAGSGQPSKGQQAPWACKARRRAAPGCAAPPQTPRPAATPGCAGLLALPQDPVQAQRVCRPGGGAGAQICCLDEAARQACSAEGAPALRCPSPHSWQPGVAPARAREGAPLGRHLPPGSLRLAPIPPPRPARRTTRWTAWSAPPPPPLGPPRGRR